MIRFCRQRDKYSCGPVALLNIDKFFGRRVTYQHLPRYSKRTKCKPVTGTKTKIMSKILGRATRRSWKKAKQFLTDGGCIVVLSQWEVNGEQMGHFYLMVTNYCNDIGVVNLYRDIYTAIRVTPQRAARILKTAERTWYVSKPVYPRHPK